MGWDAFTLAVRSKRPTVQGPPDGEARLLVRGDLSGAHVQYQDVEIEIPRRVLIQLVAEQVRSSRIARLEQATTTDLLGPWAKGDE